MFFRKNPGSLKEYILLFGRKMYLAFFSLRFLAAFSILVLVGYIFFPNRMEGTVAFVTAIVSSFTTIVLGAIGANYLIARNNHTTDPQTQVLEEKENEEEAINDGDNQQVSS